ncbi:MAG TPA: ECF-type sigma factor [Pyrinomonadaceae bacterium]|nr:ECF-type sigma factor [Pyrinomonadaceae bacterium]
MAQSHKITELLEALNNGDPHALDELIPLVDYELRQIAHAYMVREKPGHTLQTTALVNEALIRLIGKKVTFTSRRQFYALVARRMRQVLIDYARSRVASRRGGRVEHINVDDAVGLSFQESRELLRLDEALTTLSEVNEVQARIVELRYFGGFTLEEIAEIAGVSPSTVEREWRSARDWLKQQMTEQSASAQEKNSKTGSDAA